MRFSKVREIIGMMDITRVPRTPVFLKGIINLRGRVIPVTDLAVKFNMPPAQRTSEQCIIVLCLPGVEMGVIVDKVIDILDIPAEAIEEAPSFGVGVDTSFIRGIGKMAGRVVILLEVAKALTTDDLLAVRGLENTKIPVTNIEKLS